MKILHIASITNNQASGVCVAVPQHIIAQAKFADIAFVNINNVVIPELENFQILVDNDDIVEGIKESFGIPELIIFHEVNYIGFIRIYKQLVKQNIPYIILPHGEITQGALSKKWLKKKVAYALLFNKFIRSAIAIQCLSQSEADRIKIKTPYKFIGTNGVYDNRDKKQNYSENCKRLLYIGRLDIIIKGLDRLINAISIDKQYFESNNITLDIYGPSVSNGKKTLQDLIDKKNLNNLVFIHPPIYGEEKYNAIKNHDMFLQTSITEGMPVGILEAMNLGLPCFLTKGTCLVDLLVKYDAGFYAGETDEELAQNLISAIEDREIKNKGINAIKLVSDNFLWDIVSENTINVYKSLVGNNGSNIEK